MKNLSTSDQLMLNPKEGSEYARASRVAMLSYASIIRRTNADLAELIEEYVRAHTPNVKNK